MNESAGLEATPLPIRKTRTEDPHGRPAKTRTEGGAPAQNREAPHQSVVIGGERHPSTRRKP